MATPGVRLSWRPALVATAPTPLDTLRSCLRYRNVLWEASGVTYVGECVVPLMIKAVMSNQDTGEQTILLGLSDENWRRMRRAGQPIKFGIAIDGKPISVAIMAGPDEDSMRAQLAEWTDLPPMQEES